MTRFSFQTRSIVLLNVASLIMLSLFFVDIWRIELLEWVTTLLFFDIVVAMPILLVLVLWFRDLTSKIVSSGQKTIIIYGFVGALMVMSYGAGMHSVTNQLSMFITHPAVELYDEHVGHFLSIVPVLLLTLYIGYIYTYHPDHKKAGRVELLIVIGSGILYGIASAVGGLESQMWWVVLVVAFLGTIILLYRLRGQRYGKLMLPVFLLFGYATNLIVLAIWFWSYGGMLQPTEVGFGIF